MPYNPEKYWIKVDGNNVPQGHPILESNMSAIFGRQLYLGGKTPPSGYLEFIKVERPELTAYQKFDDSVGSENSDAYANNNGLKYEFADDYWDDDGSRIGKIKEVWYVLEMTDAEKKAKQDDVKAKWAALSGAPASWVFDEATCTFIPPVTKPDDGKNYDWDESTTSWKEVT